MQKVLTRWAVIGVALWASACVRTDATPGAQESGAEVKVVADGVEEAVWSADGRRLAATWTVRGRTRLFGLLGPAGDQAPEQGRGIPLADGAAGWASWSPDGLWIVYAAGEEGAREIVRARPDGTGAETLSAHPADDYDPAFGPDGRTVVFVSTRDGGTPKLHVMTADGSGSRLLADVGAPVRRPQWSPDGRRLAVQVTDGGEEEVFLVSADGSGWGRLGTGALPAWFSDGERVVFTERDSVFWRPANGGARRFVVADARVGRPSPDGRWLAFVRPGATGPSLYLLDLETQAVTPLSTP